MNRSPLTFLLLSVVAGLCAYACFATYPPQWAFSVSLFNYIVLVLGFTDGPKDNKQ